MRKDCTKFLEGLVRLAEGGEDALAAFHSASCADCARRLEQFREIYSAASRSYYDAPPTDIEAAIALMPKRNRHIATLFRSSLVLAGALSVREDLQLLV